MKAVGAKEETDIKKINPSVLENSEELFFYLLEDERLFNRDKFRKALLDEKGNNVAKYNNEQKEKREKKELNNKSILGKDKDKLKNTSIMMGQVQKKDTAQFGQSELPQKDLRSPSPGAQPDEQQAADPKANDTSNFGALQVKPDAIKDKESLAVFLNSHNAKKADASKKEIGQINIYGEQMLKKTKVPMWSFFQDLNYGDMAIVFNNPFYDFMLKERQELDLYRLDYLEVLSNREKGRVDMSPAETRKQEKYKQEQKDKIIAKYKALLEQKKDENRRVDLYDAFEFYKNFMEGKADAGDHQRKEKEGDSYQRTAFLNALIFFSSRYYVNDMKRIDQSNQPYSKISAYSLRDFLRDPQFEFHLFHTVAFTRFYTDYKNLDAQPEKLKFVDREKLTFFERFLGTETIKYQISTVDYEESNYSLVKKYDEEWSQKQFLQYQDLCLRLSKEALAFYKEHKKSETGGAKKTEANKSDVQPKSDIKPKYEFNAKGFAKLLADVSGLKYEPGKASSAPVPQQADAAPGQPQEEPAGYEKICLKFIKEDMRRRGDASNFDKYFSNQMIVMEREKVKEEGGKKGDKKAKITYVPKIRKFERQTATGLLFEYKEGYESLLRGFTIDERIFHNLLRKMVILKLNMNNIWTRQSYSSDFTRIFVVVKAQDSVIQSIAASTSYPKQIELGFSDLLSLEPVDEFFRPYRVKERTFREIATAKYGRDPDEENKRVPDTERNVIEIPPSTDKDVVARTISLIESKNDDTFEVYLNSMHVMTERTLDDMKQIAAMKCLGDKNLFAKPKEDRIEPRHHQEAYYIFAGIVRYWHKMFQRMINTKDKAERAAYESLAGLVYRLIYLKAYGATNAAYDYVERSCLKIVFCCRWRKRNRVQHLWDRIEVAPIAPFADYDPSHSIWRTYQTNERKDRNAFRSMDRIKLLNGELENTFNLSELQANRIVSAVLPLHDNYMLKGESRLELFDKFDDVYNYADPPSITEKKAQINMLLEGMADESEASDFVKDPLNVILGLDIFNPTDIDIDAIQSYFGEKIALYFSFLSYHTQRLLFIGWFGVAIFIVDLIMTNDIGFRANAVSSSGGFAPSSIDLNNLQSEDIALIIFKINRILVCIVTAIWSTHYLEMWKRRQKLFAITYGMLDFESTEKTRTNFKGNFERDLASTEFNKKVYPDWKRNLRTIFSYFLIIILIGCSFIVSLLCMYLRAELDKQQIKNQFVVYFLPSFLNYIFITLLNRVFNALSLYLNNKENYETLTKFEDSLISKVFVFNFFNSFITYFMIAFVKYILTRAKVLTFLFGYCTTTDPNFDLQSFQCYEELFGHSWSMFLLTFLFNFFEFLAPLIFRLFISRLVGFKRRDSWAKIDQQIEAEYKLQDFMITSEVDAIMYDYKEITIQFTSLSFFGIIFPLSYFLAYITSIFEIRIDMSYFLKYFKRPIPRSVSDIGNWQFMLEGVSFLTIFINLGIAIFTCDAMREIHFLVFDEKENYIYYNDEEYLFSQRLKYFVIGVFILLAIKQLLAVLIEDIPENLRVIQARHKNIINKFINKSRESNSNAKSGMPMHIMPSDIGMLIEGANAADRKGNKGATKENNQATANPNSVYNKIKFNPADFATDFNPEAAAPK